MNNQDLLKAIEFLMVKSMVSSKQATLLERQFYGGRVSALKDLKNIIIKEENNNEKLSK